MTDIERLLFNVINNALETFQKTGVGHIDMEQTGKIYYKIDGKEYLIQVGISECGVSTPDMK